MHFSVVPPDQWPILPDHTQLPARDESIAETAQEEAQSNLLTDCLLPRLREIHPDGQFYIGCNVRIYWQYIDPNQINSQAPDWFYVPNVPPILDGVIDRSYVLWDEPVRPLILIEYVSGDGSEEHDKTPYKGKFWIYEQAVCAPYYAIFERDRASLEVFRLEMGRYHVLPANQAGRFPIEPLRIELGIWQGHYRTMTCPWLRVWDADTGKMILLSEERAEAAEGLIDPE